MPTSSHASSDGGLIFYDGACDFCRGAVGLVRANDPSARFRFAPLASAAGHAALASAGRDPFGPSSLLLDDADGVHAESEAVIRIGRGMRAPWPLLASIAGSIPRPIRDAAYRWIVRRRVRRGG